MKYIYASRRNAELTDDGREKETSQRAGEVNPRRGVKGGFKTFQSWGERGQQEMVKKYGKSAKEKPKIENSIHH